MRVLLASGAEIDLATSEDLDKLAGKVINALAPPSPRAFNRPAAKTTPGAPLTYTFIDLGGPALPGQYEDVLRYTLFTNDPFAAGTGTVLAFVASIAPGDSNTEPSFPNMVDFATTIPAVATWQAHQLTLKFQEHLILCIKGASASTQYIASLQGQRYAAAKFEIT